MADAATQEDRQSVAEAALLGNVVSEQADADRAGAERPNLPTGRGDQGTVPEGGIASNEFDEAAEYLYREHADLLELYYERAGILEYDATDRYAVDGRTCYPQPSKDGNMPAGWTDEQERRAHATRLNASMDALEYVREHACRDQQIGKR